MIKLIHLLNESINKLPYENWEKGVIKAWGHTLYLSFHKLPLNIDKLVTDSMLKDEFEKYYKCNDEKVLEEYDDLFTDLPPKYKQNLALFDKRKISNILQNISNKTKLDNELLVYRSMGNSNRYGWNSYTMNKDLLHFYPKKFKRTLLIPKNFPIIYTQDKYEQLADIEEVIINLSIQQIKDFEIDENS